ncbi:interleukin-20 receptor subunit alpha isoform X1 [Danio aesculapii]|uniref:interleukin-20 receptor subunit alpha isoform X1 n=1 Tax=Danio aesculapii TaxID=1142201 RepID=UPI0024BF58FF|nr:interleukin-20 receptor subunit alpha isoform X1 [Danio aesculapii]
MDVVLSICLCFLLRALSASSADGPPEPRDVHIYSESLRNVVKWTAGDGSPSDTVYTVEYAIYGDADEKIAEQVRWRPVDQCVSVSQTECDVSQETFDLRDEYFARVRAASKHGQSVWSESVSRFRPLSDTILGAPLVDVTVRQNHMDITLKGPFRWRTKRMTKEKSLWRIIPNMIYKVSVFNSRSNRTDVFRLTNGSLSLGELEFSTQFCVVAQAQSESLPLSYIPSEKQCVHTPKDPFRDQLLAAMLGGVLPSALCLCVMAVLGALIRCYITDHRQKLPKSTQLVQMSEKLQTFKPEVPQTIIFNIKLDESTALRPALPLPFSIEDSSEEPVNAVPQPAGSYAQQQPLPPAGPASLSGDLQDGDSLSLYSEPLADRHSEAGDYGFVIPAEFDHSQVEVSHYRTQGHTADPQDHHIEEEAQIFVDWSPESRELKIPLMGLLGLEDESGVHTEAVSLLPNLILTQTSVDSGEQEDDFSMMERNWGLVIHSSPE